MKIEDRKKMIFIIDLFLYVKIWFIDEKHSVNMILLINNGDITIKRSGVNINDGLRSMKVIWYHMTLTPLPTICWPLKCLWWPIALMSDLRLLSVIR